MEWFWSVYWGTLGFIGAGFTVAGLVGIAIGLLNAAAWVIDRLDRWISRARRRTGR